MGRSTSLLLLCLFMATLAHARQDDWQKDVQRYASLPPREQVREFLDQTLAGVWPLSLAKQTNMARQEILIKAPDREIETALVEQTESTNESKAAFAVFLLC